MANTNALIHERSPYLLQHAHNPVNWYPWCEEAFLRAKQEEKPIFLSIGYSTCHWCHVMAQESFEDLEVARLLNDHFVCIKVDKEERPDIDAVYMQACQAMTGSGGWPLSIWMTPDQLPFFCGTYFPKHTQGPQIGFVELLERISDLWMRHREDLAHQGRQIQALFSSPAQRSSAALPSDGVLSQAVSELASRFDTSYGGFGHAPKFPTPQHLLFLLQYGRAYRHAESIEMVSRTLIGMYQGGIFDHIGGGFCRYATDAKWLVPHFEKMLYDNAQMASVLVLAHQCTRNPLFGYMAERTLDYLLEEMQAEEGGFYSAQDADSDHEEGKYYVFTPQEIQTVLGESAGRAFCQAYHITPQGNFEGKSIPNLLGAEPSVPQAALRHKLDALLSYRRSRTVLHRDDKILTSWNSMAVSAFAFAGRSFRRPDYLRTAERANAFLLRNLYDADGRLHIRYREGEVKGLGLLDDYAYFAQAQLDLYESTLDASYLLSGMEIARKMHALFWDEQEGGFFLAPADGESLFFRPKEFYDNALPSGNSVALDVLCRLSSYQPQGPWKRILEKQLEALSSLFDEMPSAASYALIGWMRRLLPAQRLVCCLTAPQEKSEVLDWLSRQNLLQTSVLCRIPGEPPICFATEYPVATNAPQYYLCKGQTCFAPVSSLESLSL